MQPPRRALLGLAALLLGLLAVAVASSGSLTTGSGGARRPSDSVLDVLFSLFLLLMAFGALLWGYILLLRKDVAAEAHAVRPRRSPWISIVGLAVALLLFAVAARWFAADNVGGRRVGGLRPLNPSSGSGGANPPNAYRPEFATGPVLVFLGLLAVAAAAWYRADRARRRRLATESQSVFPPLAEVLEETLDDLRAEADPRRAVIAAYARMERALAAYGLARSPAEAPDEYLRRIFAELDVSRRSTARLTALFARAKFSPHDVDFEMKQEAIDALEAVRDELRAAEILREHERRAGPFELRGRAIR